MEIQKMTKIEFAIFLEIEKTILEMLKTNENFDVGDFQKTWLMYVFRMFGGCLRGFKTIKKRLNISEKNWR